MRHPHAEPPHPVPASPDRPLTSVATSLLLVLLLAAASLLLAAPARAHDTLLGSEPAADATLDEAPTQIVLTFSADQIEVGTAVAVTGPDGEDVTDGDVVVDGPEVRRPLSPDLVDGSYTVEWRSVSGDGHALSDTFDFVLDGVGDAPAQGDEAEPQAEAEPDAAADPTQDAAPAPAPTATSDAAPEAAEPAGTADAVDTDDASGGVPWLVVAGVALVLLAALVVVRRVRGRTGE